MAKKMQSFHVQATIKCSIGIEIKAENIQDAIKQAGELKPSDFYSTDGDVNDHEIIGFDWIGTSYPEKFQINTK